MRVKEVRVRNAHDFVWKVSDEIETVISRELRDKGHYATGHLSISNRPVEWEDGDGRVRVLIENTDPAAYVLHFGSKPHRPPLYPLIEWAMAKYGDLYHEAVSRAFRVRAVIMRQGNIPYMWVDGLYERLKEEMRDVFST